MTKFVIDFPFDDGFDLEAQRKRLGLSREDVAKELDVTYKTVERYERLSKDELRNRLSINTFETLVNLLYSDYRL